LIPGDLPEDIRFRPAPGGFPQPGQFGCLLG